MIPKVINYCWFGNNPKPQIIEKCMASWKKFCPDYEIIEWNETNFDINCCDYVKGAYDQKKWAFVSDYARFFILNQHGGIYLDTDVELIKPIDVFLMQNFTGFETATSVATGLIMGAEANNTLCQVMLDQYHNDTFVSEEGINLKTVCVRVTDILVNEGLKLEDSNQEVMSFKIYNSKYFNPYNMDTGRIKLSEETVSIHRYASTWVPRNKKIRGKVFQLIARFFGINFANKVRKLINAPKKNEKR